MTNITAYYNTGKDETTDKPTQNADKNRHKIADRISTNSDKTKFIKTRPRPSEEEELRRLLSWKSTFYICDSLFVSKKRK